MWDVGLIIGHSMTYEENKDHKGKDYLTKTQRTNKSYDKKSSMFQRFLRREKETSPEDVEVDCTSSLSYSMSSKALSCDSEKQEMESAFIELKMFICSERSEFDVNTLDGISLTANLAEQKKKLEDYQPKKEEMMCCLQELAVLTNRLSGKSYRNIQQGEKEMTMNGKKEIDALIKEMESKKKDLSSLQNDRLFYMENIERINEDLKKLQVEKSTIELQFAQIQSDISNFGSENEPESQLQHLKELCHEEDHVANFFGKAQSEKLLPLSRAFSGKTPNWLSGRGLWNSSSRVAPNNNAIKSTSALVETNNAGKILKSTRELMIPRPTGICGKAA